MLAGLLDRFVYLKPGLAIILLFIGVKMVGSAWVHVPTAVSLAVIVGVLALAIGLDLLSRPLRRSGPLPLFPGRIRWPTMPRSTRRFHP